MSHEIAGDSAAARLSSDDDAATRIIRDSGVPEEPSSHVPIDARRGPAWWQTFLSKYALIIVWALMALFFYQQMPDIFGSAPALSAIFGSQQAVVLIFLAMAAMVTLIVGEFDLSIASVMGLTAVMVPVLVTYKGWSVPMACVGALVAALLCGAVNAFFVVVLDVSSFVVTLGTATLILGMTQWVSDSSLVSLIDEGFSSLSITQYLGLPVSLYYGVGLTLLIAYVLAFTPLGRHMLFVGANREVARLAGIRVNRIRFGAYLVGAVLAGLAGMILVSSLGGFDSATSASFLLPALAAVFLGTAVVQPGQFNPIGTLIAIFFLQTGIFGLQLMGFPGWIQNVFYGAGLVVAVALAKIVRNRSRAS